MRCRDCSTSCLSIHAAEKPILWFYTPMMFRFAAHVDAAAVVYDCMDELSSFRFAPPELRLNEEALLRRADVVFTGGHSIYEAKRDRHRNIHPFPSSVDTAHFAAARTTASRRPDQSRITGPVFGYYGVIDERIDLKLIAASRRGAAGMVLVMVGPLAKLDAADLPRAPNIHYLGHKAICRAAVLRRRLGRGADAVRAQ